MSYAWISLRLRKLTLEIVAGQEDSARESFGFELGFQSAYLCARSLLRVKAGDRFEWRFAAGAVAQLPYFCALFWQPFPRLFENAPFADLRV